MLENWDSSEVQAYGNWVWVAQQEAPEKINSIYIPDNHRVFFRQGKVLKIGHTADINVKEGDLVTYNAKINYRFFGPCYWDGEKISLLLVGADEIEAVVPKDVKQLPHKTGVHLN